MSTMARAGSGRVEPEHDGIEVVSPVLTNAQDLRHLQDAARALSKAGAYVTDNLGLHIHIGAGAFSPYQMAHLLVLVHRYESALYLALDVHARRRANWCGPLPDASVEAVALAAPVSYATFAQAYRSEGPSSRYHSVNFENALAGMPEKNTIEFRLFNATLCPSAIACHVSLVMGLAAKALAAPLGPNVGKQLAPLPPFKSFVTHMLDAPTSTRLVANLDTFSRDAGRATPRLAAALADENYAGAVSRMLAAGISVAELEQWVMSTSPHTRDAFVRAARGLLLLRNHSASRPLMFELLQTVPQCLWHLLRFRWSGCWFPERPPPSASISFIRSCRGLPPGERPFLPPVSICTGLAYSPPRRLNCLGCKIG